MREEFKSVCDVCGRKTWYAKKQRCQCLYPKKRTCKACRHFEVIEPLIMEQCKGTLRLIDNSKLDKRFNAAYESGVRVEVINKAGFEDFSGYGARTGGRKNRFYVGKSTGWIPIYLMILNKTSTGGASICSEAIESVRIIS